MKKQLLAIALLTAGLANAQTWSQDFNSVTTPGLPATWLQNNVDGHTVTTSLSSYSFAANAWVTRDFSTSTDPATAAHGKFAISTSWYTPAGISNDWLITPSFTVPTNAVISWDAMAPDASYPDGYLVKISTTGTLTTDFSTTLLTVGSENSTWNTRSLNLNSYAGQTVRIAFINNSNDMDLLFVDNVSVIVPASVDLKITSVGPTGQASWGSVGSAKTISGTITNNGYTNLTAFTAHYTDGVNSGVNNFTGLNLAYGQSYPFNFTTTYPIASASQSSIKVWADLSGDGIHTNDTLNAYVKGYSFVPNHKVVFEEGTGTWCGWCVRGAVYMDSMNNVNPNTTALIAVHNGDPMVCTPYDAGVGTLISGYPTALCDRAVDIIDPSDMFTAYAAHINDFGLGDLTITPTYNSSTRVANVVVNTQIASTFPNNTATNDYRLAVVFTENNVTGTATTYNQHNYYAGGASGPMVGAGHHFDTEPDPVLAANMKYDFVARTILGGFSGQANSLPSSLVAGTTYTSSVFSYTIPAAYNANNMKIHALLIDATTNEIYNANTVILPIVTGFKPVSSEKIEVALFPNPTKNNATIELSLTKTETVNVNVINMMGEVVFSQTLNNLSAGNQTIYLNSENWANGIYNVNITTSSAKVSRKLEVIK